MAKILEQDEIDALLQGLSEGDISTTAGGLSDDGTLVSFDLANQDRIIRGRMPVLEIINDRFARIYTNALANTMRKRVEINPISTDMTKFGDFIRSLPVPTSISIFKMEPLRGNGIFVLDSRLVFALVENFFGGAGAQPKVEGRDFTPIEQAIIDRVIRIALQNMEESWTPVHEIHVDLVRTEINPQFATIVPPSDVVIIITFEVELENTIGTLTCCLPYTAMEPIRSKLHASFQTERLEIDQTWMNRFKDRIQKTSVEMCVTLGKTEITSTQLLSLEIGDILMLDTDEDGLLKADIEGIRKFYGIPGRVKGNKAFQIIKEEEISY